MLSYRRSVQLVSLDGGELQRLVEELGAFYRQEQIELMTRNMRRLTEEIFREYSPLVIRKHHAELKLEVENLYRTLLPEGTQDLSPKQLAPLRKIMKQFVKVFRALENSDEELEKLLRVSTYNPETKQFNIPLFDNNES